MSDQQLEGYPRGDEQLLVTTRRGRSVAIRHLRAADQALLVEMYRRLSPQTRWLRFLEAANDLPDDVVAREAARLAQIDSHTQAALIALVTEDATEHAVGVARYARQPEQLQRAELALVVRDDYQRDGLGSRMLGMLVQLARESGIEQLLAHTLSENIGVQRLIRHSGLPLASETHRGEVTITIDLRGE